MNSCVNLSAKTLEAWLAKLPLSQVRANGASERQVPAQKRLKYSSANRLLRPIATAGDGARQSGGSRSDLLVWQ